MNILYEGGILVSKNCLRKVTLIFTLFLTFSLIISGCAKPLTTNNVQGNEQPQKEKVLIVASDQDVDSLDQTKTGWFSDAIFYIYDRLIQQDNDGTLRPGLAEKWEASEDGLTWTFCLKKGVKFHDGKPLTADDVKWTIDRILDPATASASASDFRAIKEVVVKDDYTVDFILNYPFANLLYVLSGGASGIANREAYEKYGDEYGIKYVIGSGPYMFEEWVKEDRLVLVKNPNYNWGPDWMKNKGKPIIDKIVTKIIPEENSRLMELEAGNVHILKDVPITALDKLENNSEIDVVKNEAPKLAYLAYPCDKEPFTDVRVRRAINHAINREEIVKYVLRDTGKRAYGYLPPILKDDYYKDSEKDGYKYDVGKAKQLLKEAGYENGLKLTLSADNITEFSRLAELLQSQLKQVGIDIEIVLYDSASYTAMLKEGKQELFLRIYSWANADILDWFLLSSQFPYPNHSRWKDVKSDELINNAASAATREERSERYKAVQKYLIEQAVWAPIYTPDRVVAVSKKVKNFKGHICGAPMINNGFDLEVK